MLKKNLVFALFLFAVTYYSLDAQSFKYKRGKQIFKDGKGKTQANLIFDYARGFYSNYSIVKSDNRWGVLDKNGNLVIKLEYDDVWILPNQFRCRKGNVVGILDISGNVIVPFEFDWVEIFRNNKALVLKEGKWNWWSEGDLVEYVDQAIEDFDEGVRLSECDDQSDDCSKMKMYEEMFSYIRYPPIAKERNIHGTVEVEVIIDEFGNVERRRILTGIGGGCDEEAIRAFDRLYSFEFVGARKDGVLVKSKVIYPMKFRLE